MASTVVAPFLALSLLLFAVVAHGCTPNCPGEQAVPATPVAVPVQSHHGQHDEHGRCPINALKLRVCINVLNGLVDMKIKGPDDCCSLLSGIADLDAAICLCTAVKANVLGIRVNLPVDLGLILNKCGKTYPTDFTC
nr:cortical cell-delineating protein-like [Oryza sativa Japonica Group]